MSLCPSHLTSQKGKKNLAGKRRNRKSKRNKKKGKNKNKIRTSPKKRQGLIQRQERNKPTSQPALLNNLVY